MPEVDAATTEFTAEAPTLTDGEATTITTIAEQLDSDLSTLEIYEGAVSGMLYVDVDDGYQRGEIGPMGLDVTHVTSPTEELEPLARIEPDEGEDVEDAIDNLAFAGD